MGRRAAVLGLLLAACTSDRGVVLPDDAELYFLVQLGPARSGAPQLFGPFDPEHPPPPLALPRDATLQLVEIDEDALAARYPAYQTAQRSTLRLVLSSPELSECVREGLLHDERELEIPVAELSPVVLEWSPDAPAWTQETRLEVPLALRFDVEVCDRGPTLTPRRFAEIDGSAYFGAIEALTPLDQDHLIATSGRGLALIERGLRPQDASRVLGLDDLELPGNFGEGADHGWMLRTSAVVSSDWPRGPVTVVVALAVALPSRNDRGGGALALATLHPGGAWTWDRVLFQRLLPEPVAPEDSRSLEAVWSDRAGRFAAVGHQLVVTGTSALGPVRVTEVPGFRARSMLAPRPPGPPHLVVGDVGSVLEADLFALSSDPSIVTVQPVRTEALLAADQLPEPPGRMIVGSALGRLFERVASAAPVEWARYAFGLPLSAGGCRGTSPTCGRWTAPHPLHGLAGLERPRGLLIITPECTAAFFRPHRDACASLVSFGTTGPVSAAGALGPRGLTQLGDRTYVSVGGAAIYEIQEDTD